MWYVEGTIRGKVQRWEGLTEELSKYVHEMLYNEGASMVRSGRM